MFSIIDLNWQIFIRVAELSSISRAALSLDMPQSVISRRIADVERECGTRLFQRTGRGVELTEFGKLVYPRIRAMSSQAEEVADQILTQSGQPVGLVTLGLLPATVPYLVSPLMAAVSEKMPSVHLRIMEGSSGQLEQWLAEGRLDFSLLLREESELKDGEQLMVRQRLHLVMRNDDAMAPQSSFSVADLSKLPLVVAARPHTMRDLLDNLTRRQGTSFRIVAEADSIRLQHEMIIAGQAYGLMIGPLARADLIPLRALPVSHPAIVRAVVLSHASQRPFTLASREVAAKLSEIARSRLPV
jgi:LysR family nitrogen assimilation transcriptional regulator